MKNSARTNRSRFLLTAISALLVAAPLAGISSAVSAAATVPATRLTHAVTVAPGADQAAGAARAAGSSRAVQTAASPATSPLSNLNDYPWAGLTDANNASDGWGMGYGQCTSYAAWKIYQNFGGSQAPPAVPDAGWFPSDGLSKSPVSGWGNAGDWAASAAAAGYTVNNTPTVGSIAQWDNGSDNGQFSIGHVAYVSAVNSDGSIDLAQYNLREDSQYSTLHMPPGGATDTSNGHAPFFVSWPDNFLHVGDANLTSPSPPSRNGFHIVVGRNTSGSAEMVALSSGGNLVHAYQDSSANEGWTGWAKLGSTPSGIVSNPAVVADADGHLEVFARNSAGAVIHSWQDNSAPDGWHYGGTVPAQGAMGIATGDPAAIVKPGTGEVELFTTLSNGTVADVGQEGQNGSNGWGTWSNIGGSCAGWPVPFADQSGTLEVFCRAHSGGLAVDTWNGQTWNGWDSIGGGPTALYGDPVAVSDADGHTEVFALTTGGALEHVYQDQSTGAWTWGSALVTSGVSSSTPTAIVWPDGRVEVFYRTTGNQLGHVYQKAANGSTGWSAPATLGGDLEGSPAAWVNPSGDPEVASLDSNLKIAHTYWTGTSWIDWVEVGGSF